MPEVNHETGEHRCGPRRHGADRGEGDAIRLDTDIGSILGYIVVGLIVGLLARLLVPAATPSDSSERLVIGIVGAVLGG